MTTALGRGVKLEIATAFNAAIQITSVSKAKPGVATKTAHGLLNGAVGFWTPTGGGMPQLDGQATRVYNKADDTFELQGLNTTAFSDWVANGTFTSVSTWGTLAEMIGYSIGGGGTSKLDDTKLSDVLEQQLNGLLAADTVTVDLLSQTYNSAIMQAIEDASIDQSYLTCRLTLHDGSVRVFRGSPSRPGESLSRGQLATGQIEFAVKGFCLRGAA